MRARTARLFAAAVTLAASVTVPRAAAAQVTPAPNRPISNRINTLTPPTSYPLLCRGTAGLNVMVRPTRIGLLIFERSAGPATAGLEPGQCAWMDRAVSGAEPNVIAHTVPEGADRDAPYLWPEVLQDSSRYWRFEAYNNRRGDLVVTKSAEATKP
ncbi:MAG TPA: hypothetical protein VFS20_18790 [Longimicrobium sp.]|nr:hypothetical protein [Longimicrobium sp.]